jgi:hypothetical protein
VNRDKHYVNVYGWWPVGRAHVYFVALIQTLVLGHVNIGEDALHNLLGTKRRSLNNEIKLYGLLA